jgi:glycosyltransferase involved in cell wall biosynthesis
MTTAIMFVTYNRINFTKRMLESFFKNTTSPYRLIIVDNGSTDQTPELLSSLHVSQAPHCESIDIQFNQENMGIAAGRNQGLLISNRYNDKYLSTLDNDIELPPHWLEDCLDIISVNPNFAVGINMEPTSYPMQTINGKTFQVKPAGNLGTACTVFTKLLHKSIGYIFFSVLVWQDIEWDIYQKREFILEKVQKTLGHIENLKPNVIKII